jgi:hypothetical protein
MIPRIHQRGTSFKSAVTYILHDPQMETTNRVDWAFSVNCGEVETTEAWRPMYDTWDRRTALKRENGVDLRGADNKAPVLHYTLAWAPGEHISKQQMMHAALMSLKALGLEQHQAVIAAHNDTAHPHVHIVANTVNPENGRTAPLKFSARALQEFAQEHDRMRLAYEAERDAAARQVPPPKINAEARAKSMAMLTPHPKLEKIRPTPAQPHHRRRALEKRDAIDRMRRHRAENDHAHLVEKDALWAVHRYERDELYRRAEEACGIAIDHVKDRFKSRWRDLYDAQRKEWKHLRSIEDKPLERAVYVIVNSERLGNGRALSSKEKAALILSPTKLFKAVEQLHKRERGGMAQVEKVEMSARLDRVWKSHEASFNNMKARHQAERETMRGRHTAENATISYYRASIELEYERRGLIPERPPAAGHPFETDAMYANRIREEINAHYRQQFGPDSVPNIPWNERPPEQPKPEPPPHDPEKAKRDMQEWMRRQQERDFDNER